MKLKYQPGDTVSNKAGLFLKVEDSNMVSVGNQGRKIANYNVRCEKCGHKFKPTHAGAFENRKSCPGCEEKPAALKTDNSGNCISICELGTVEFIRGYQEEQGVSERAAVRHFIEIVKAHLSGDDPAVENMTEESVLAKTRRATGKKKDTNHGEPPQKKEKKYSCSPTIEGVQHFLDKHLPGFTVVEVKT